MKVKIIKADDILNLETKVNKFLNNINDSSIIDIKYQGISNYSAHRIDYPSAMVILKS